MSFDEKYRRVTTYLERGSYDELQGLREDCEIGSITKFFNTAVKNVTGEHGGLNVRLKQINSDDG